MLGTNTLGETILGGGVSTQSVPGGGGAVFNPAPDSLWSGYSYSADTLHIPLAALPNLSAAACDATTGDWRAIVLALQSQFWLHYSGLATEDRPQALTVKPPRSSIPYYGDFAEKLHMTFEVQCYCSFEAPQVVDEPA